MGVVACGLCTPLAAYATSRGLSISSPEGRQRARCDDAKKPEERLQQAPRKRPQRGLGALVKAAASQCDFQTYCQMERWQMMRADVGTHLCEAVMPETPAPRLDASPSSASCTPSPLLARRHGGGNGESEGRSRIQEPRIRPGRDQDPRRALRRRWRRAMSCASICAP
jgi:hypothetical protein